MLKGLTQQSPGAIPATVLPRDRKFRVAAGTGVEEPAAHLRGCERLRSGEWERVCGEHPLPSLGPGGCKTSGVYFFCIFSASGRKAV